MFKICNKRLFIIMGILGALFSAFNILGSVLQKSNSLAYLTAKDFILWIIGTSIITAILVTITLLLDSGYINIQLKSKGRHLFVLSFIIILASYIISLLAAFPGVFSYDAPHQLWQFVTGKILNNQPVISSAIIYGIMSVGKRLFGTQEGGVFFYIILQIFFAATTFSYMLFLIYENTKSFVLYIIGLIFFAFHPMNQLFVVNCAKDVVYAYFVAWIIMLIGIAEKNELKFFTRRRNCVLLALFLLLFLFYRNNSIYALIICAIFALIHFKKTRKQLFIIFATTIGCFYIVTGPVYNALNLQVNSLNEMLAIPEQQIVNTYIKHGDDFTDEEMQMFVAVFPEGTRQEYEALYSPTNSDLIRPTLNSSAIKEMGISKFIKLWAGIGLRHPLSYLDAALNNTRGYWYLNHQYTMLGSDRYIEYTNSEYEIGIHTERSPILKSLSKNYYRKIAEGTTGKNIFTNWLFSIASTFIAFLYLIAFAIYKKRKNLCVAITLLAMLYITLFAGPLALMRYAYPVTLCLPFLFSMVLSKDS